MTVVALNKLWPSDTFDRFLFACFVALVCIGFVAMASASIEYAAVKYGNPFHHVIRYGVHLSLGLVAAAVAYRIPMAFWESSGWVWLFAGLALLVLVLVPGVGREVNGSQRWIPLGPLTLQCSEVAKACVIIYMAGYLVRRQEEVREKFSGFVKPMIVLFMVTLLLLLEPDFGATVVTVGVAFGMLFLAGVRLGQFLLVILSALMAMAVMVVTSPYRMKRLTAYTDPWADQFDSGYQLTQALIAFGRGEWFGVGLGNSVQKLFYLPEAHTDFVFAILAEEFGFIGSLLVVSLFALLVLRIFQIGRQSEQVGKVFGGYVCYGIAFMIAGQAFINIGVNTGLLPTKGLTLPFLSYGGSSLMVCCGLLGIVMRVQQEIYQRAAQGKGAQAKGVKNNELP
jgi:cell division protein FtsW